MSRASACHNYSPKSSSDARMTTEAPIPPRTVAKSPRISRWAAVSRATGVTRPDRRPRHHAESRFPHSGDAAGAQGLDPAPDGAPERRMPGLCSGTAQPPPLRGATRATLLTRITWVELTRPGGPRSTREGQRSITMWKPCEDRGRARSIGVRARAGRGVSDEGWTGESTGDRRGPTGDRPGIPHSAPERGYLRRCATYIRKIPRTTDAAGPRRRRTGSVLLGP